MTVFYTCFKYILEKRCYDFYEGCSHYTRAKNQEILCRPDWIKKNCMKTCGLCKDSKSSLFLCFLFGLLELLSIVDVGIAERESGVYQTKRYLRDFTEKNILRNKRKEKIKIS